MQTIKQLQADLQAGRTTSEKLVEQSLAAIDTYRKAGGTAFIHIDADASLQAARASDAARRAGNVPSPIAGLPVSIKDLFDVRGQVTAAGSRALEYDQRVARARLMAVAADRLRDADAWLMPTVAVMPPRVDDLQTDEAFFAINAMVLRNTSVINFLDGCGVSLPAGQPGIGLSVCGPRGADARILQVAGAVEAALG